MAKTYLPPGFRFHPTDVELIKYYLKRKVMGKSLHLDPIAEVDIYKFAPWDLPDKSHLRSGDLKWYFFCPREKKYASGIRLKRATEFGFWKATGKDRPVLYDNEVVGLIKTLVFHVGKAPRGERTDWVMHEYRLEDKDLAARQVVQDAFVVCVIFKKDGPGPRNGAQYGAPFREEDWNDDVEVHCTEIVSVPIHPEADSSALANQPDSLATTSHIRKALYVESLAEPCADSGMLPSANNMLPQLGLPEASNDDVLSMVHFFMDGSDEFVWNNRSENQKNDEENTDRIAGVPPGFEGNNALSRSTDFSNLNRVCKDVHNPTLSGTDNLNETIDLDALVQDASFIEMFDLDAPLNVPIQAGSSHQLQENAFQCYNYTPGQSNGPLDIFPASGRATESDQTHSEPAEEAPEHSNTFQWKSF